MHGLHPDVAGWVRKHFTEFDTADVPTTMQWVRHATKHLDSKNKKGKGGKGANTFFYDDEDCDAFLKDSPDCHTVETKGDDNLNREACPRDVLAILTHTQQRQYTLLSPSMSSVVCRPLLLIMKNSIGSNKALKQTKEDCIHRLTNLFSLKTCTKLPPF